MGPLAQLDSRQLYLGLLLLLSAERLVELLISRRNAAWVMARGGVELGQGHFRAMALLHGLFLVSCAAEVWLLGRPFSPWLGYPMLALALCCQALRYWAMASLGRHWNVRVIVLPGAAAVATGPYRLMRHPNYLAVILEGVALPLVHGAWLTAAAFSLLNAWLLRVRIRCEEQALSRHARGYGDGPGRRPRFFPGTAGQDPARPDPGGLHD